MGEIFDVAKVCYNRSKEFEVALATKDFNTLSAVLVVKTHGYDYKIHYKSGNENVVAGDLSRVSGSELLYMVVSVVDSNLSSKLKEYYNLDMNIQHLMQTCNNFTVGSKFRIGWFDKKKG